MKLQVNSKPTATVLQKFVRDNGTHAILAATDYNQNAEDPAEELERALDDLKTQVKKRLW